MVRPLSDWVNEVADSTLYAIDVGLFRGGEEGYCYGVLELLEAMGTKVGTFSGDDPLSFVSALKIAAENLKENERGQSS